MDNLDPDAVLAIVIGAIVAVHIVFGIISARVASGKGRDPLLGFALGLLLNIFGLIIVMLMRPSIEAEARRRIEVEQEYGRQQRSGPDPVVHATDAEGHRHETISVRRARYGDVIDLRVIVLSTPDQRARGLSVLASEAVMGILYFWLEGGTHEVKFLNPYSRIKMHVAVVDAEDRIQEFLTLAAGDDSAIEPTNPVGSAIAFRAERLEDIEIDIGDIVGLPYGLRP